MAVESTQPPKFLDLPGRAPGVGALRLGVREWGGSGPPVLLLHGLASNSRIWDLMVPHLRQRFYVVAVDQRGHGLSDVPEDGYGFPEVTADAAAVIEALGLDRPVVVGHSWGGGVALQLAADQPQLVRALVLVDGGFAQLSSAQDMTWEKAEQMMRPPEIDGVGVEQFLGFAKNWPDVKDLWSDQLAEMMLSNFRVEDGKIYRRLPIERHMKVVRAIWDQAASDLWPRIECPVLMVPAIGKENPRHQGWNARKLEGIQEARQHLKRSSVLVMEDTIHDVPIQRPRELAEAISEFAANV